MLGLPSLLAFAQTGRAADTWAIFAAYAFALAYSLIAAVVLLVLLAILIVRVVMIWIYVVLSPLAYLLATFPQGKSYVSQWWDDFTKNVVVGPILAFFIWLSLVSLGNTTSGTNILGNNAPTDSLAKMTNGLPQGVTNAMGLDQLIKFSIAIGMLVGGLIITQKMGGYMGKIAGKGFSAIQGGIKGIKHGADWLNIKAATKFGTPDFNLVRQKERIGAALKEGKAKDLEQMQGAAGRRFKKGGVEGAFGVLGGAAGGYDAYLKGFLGLKGWGKQIFGGLAARKLSTQGIVVENREKQDESNKLASTVMSEEGYKETRDRFDSEGTRLSGEIAAAQRDQVTAERDLHDAGAKFGIGSDEYEKAKGKKEKADEEVDKKQQLFNNNSDEIFKLEAIKKQAQATKDEKGRRLWVDSEDKAKERKTEYRQDAQVYGEKAAGFQLMDYEGFAAMRAADREAGRKITSADEDELGSIFDVAVAQEDAPLARALMGKLAAINGTNTLFNKYGYQAELGFNEETYNKLQERIKGPDTDDSKKAKEEYDDGKGTHDFIRDFFVGKLKMDKQQAFAFQNDIASISEAAPNMGADHLKKSVRIDSAGVYHQATEEEHAQSELRESLKGDSESTIRRSNRLNFGAEDKVTKQFKFSTAGLAYAMNNLGIIMAEVGRGRLNKSTAKAFAEPGAQKQMLEMLNKLGIKDIKSGDKRVSVQDFFSMINDYASASSEANIEKLLGSTRSAPPAGGKTP
jgi:hypothetical protein